MKRLSKISVILTAALVCVMGLSSTAFAAEADGQTSGGLTASIVTDKEEYSSDEEISVDFSVTNTNDYSVNDVTLSAIIPDGLAVKDNAATSTTAKVLEKGESEGFSVVLYKEKESPNSNEGGSSSTSGTESTNSANSTASKNSSSNTSGKAAATASSGAAAAAANKDGKSVTTGDARAIAVLVIVLIGAGALILVNKKKASKMLSLVLCVSICGASIAAIGIPTADAAESGKDFAVSKTIKVDNKQYEIGVNVAYNANENEDTDSVTRGELVDMLVKAFSMTSGEYTSADVSFTDIQTHKYADSITAAYYNGILLTNTDKFRPDDKATREFAAYTLNQCLCFANNDDLTCDDFESIKYKDAASALVEQGYFELIDNKFMPERAVTKDEMSNFSDLIAENLARTEIDENHENVLDLNDDVPVLNTVIKSTDKNKVTLELNDETSELKEGDVFCAYDENANTYVAYKVQSISKSENEIEVTVTEPEVYELYNDVDIQGVASAKASDAELLVDGVSVVQSTSKTVKNSGNSKISSIFDIPVHMDSDIEIAEDIVESKLQFKTEIGITKDGNLATGDEKAVAKVTLDGGLKAPKVKYAIDFKVNPLTGKIKDDYNFLIALEDQLYFDGTAKVDSSSVFESDSVELANFPIEPLPGVRINILLKLVVSAEGEVTIGYTVGNTVGINIYGGDKGIPTTQFIKEFNEPTFEIAAEVKLTLGMRPEVDLSLCNQKLVGVYTTVGGKASINANTWHDTKLHTDFSAYFYIDVGIYTDGLLKEILAKCGCKTSLTEELVNEENSPLKVKKHFEGTTETENAECTYRYLKGVVKSGKAFIEGAKVTVYNGNTEIAVENNVTNGLGEFGFLIPAPKDGTTYPKDLTVKVTKDGYKEWKKKVTVETHKDTEVKDINLEKATGGNTENYRDDFIQALLENESTWLGDSDICDKFQFVDINFDGNLEFVTTGCNPTSTSPTSCVYYYENNEIKKAGGFTGSLTGYYNKTENRYLILGEDYMHIDAANNWQGNYILNFDGREVTQDYYSSEAVVGDFSSGSTIHYYIGANGFGSSDGCEEITEERYNEINDTMLKDLVDINMNYGTISCSDWKNYTDSKKWQKLEKFYYTFTYDDINNYKDEEYVEAVKAYKQYIQENRVVESASYYLINVNDDQIPELVIDTHSGAYGTTICTYDGKVVQSVSRGQSGVMYNVFHNNLFLNYGGHMGVYFDYVYKIDNGKPVKLYAGDYEEPYGTRTEFKYTWTEISESGESNSKEVTKDEYETELNSAFNPNEAIYVDELGRSFSYDGILSYFDGVLKY